MAIPIIMFAFVIILNLTNEEIKKSSYLLIGIMLIVVLTAFQVAGNIVIEQEAYIQNLEEKLNIYERSYEEFCLEDSLRQVE